VSVLDADWEGLAERLPVDENDDDGEKLRSRARRRGKPVALAVLDRDSEAVVEPMCERVIDCEALCVTVLVELHEGVRLKVMLRVPDPDAVTEALARKKNQVSALETECQ